MMSGVECSLPVFDPEYWGDAQELPEYTNSKDIMLGPTGFEADIAEAAGRIVEGQEFETVTAGTPIDVSGERSAIGVQDIILIDIETIGPINRWRSPKKERKLPHPTSLLMPSPRDTALTAAELFRANSDHGAWPDVTQNRTRILPYRKFLRNEGAGRDYSRIIGPLVFKLAKNGKPMNSIISQYGNQASGVVYGNAADRPFMLGPIFNVSAMEVGVSYELAKVPMNSGTIEYIGRKGQIRVRSAEKIGEVSTRQTAKRKPVGFKLNFLNHPVPETRLA